MFHPRLYKTHPPTGRCSAGSAPRKRPFPAFSGTYPHLLCLLYYSGICRHFQVTMKFISGCFYTRLWSQSSFLLSAPGVVTMTFSGVVSRNTSPTASLPSAVTSLDATGTTLSAPLAQVASVCPVCQEALSGEESAEAPPAAEEARRFRGSVPFFTPQRGWKSADTTVKTFCRYWQKVPRRRHKKGVTAGKSGPSETAKKNCKGYYGSPRVLRTLAMTLLNVSK